METRSIVTLSHPVFNELERNWISSSYFDRGMNYENSRFKVVSFSRLLEKFTSKGFNAITLNCFDDYEGLISFEDILRYDLQLAIKIELNHGVGRPEWLQPLLILVPDGKNPPFSERFLTANIKELKFVRLADYYAPLDNEPLFGASSDLGRKIFKDNCLFCHSINSVGGNKGGSLLKKFNFRLIREKLRFQEAFTLVHGQNNASKQNTKQFLEDNHLEALSNFLSQWSDIK